MTPSLQVLVAPVLEAVLAPLVEFDHVGADGRWHRLVPCVLQHGLMDLISHNCEGFGLWWR